jgi:hypothetical protein
MTAFFGFFTAGPWLPDADMPVWAAGLPLPMVVLCGGATLVVLVAAVRGVPLDDAATHERLRRTHDRARIPDALTPGQRFLAAAGFLAGAAVIFGGALHPDDLLASLLSLDVLFAAAFGGCYLVFGLVMALPYGPRRVLLRMLGLVSAKERLG